jgi:hypothetical protein
MAAITGSLRFPASMLHWLARTSSIRNDGTFNNNGRNGTVNSGVLQLLSAQSDGRPVDSAVYRRFGQREHCLCGGDVTAQRAEALSR